MTEMRNVFLLALASCGCVGESQMTRPLSATNVGSLSEDRVALGRLRPPGDVDLESLRQSRDLIAEHADAPAGYILAAYHLAQLGVPEEAEPFVVAAYAMVSPGQMRERLGSFVGEIELRRASPQLLAREQTSVRDYVSTTAFAIGHVLASEQHFAALCRLISQQIANGSWASAIALLRLARATEADLASIEKLDLQISSARRSQIERAMSQWRSGNSESALGEHRKLAEFAGDSSSLRVWMIQRYIMTSQTERAVSVTKEWFPGTGAQVWRDDAVIAGMVEEAAK